MTKQQFLTFYQGDENINAGICYTEVEKALKDLGIYTQLTLIGALGTVRVEVGRNFKPIREIASGATYEGRGDLGNTQDGDGKKFKGRGYIQLTGRSNYTSYGKKLGIDLVNDPDLALEVGNSARILAQYFKDRKVNVACDAQDWVKVRKLVNGGSNGLNEFIRVVGQYLLVAKQK